MSKAQNQWHTVVVVCLCVCLCRELSRVHSLPPIELSTETRDASLTQYYLEMKLVDFGLVALLVSYGVIYVGHLDGYFLLSQVC